MSGEKLVLHVMLITFILVKYFNPNTYVTCRSILVRCIALLLCVRLRGCERRVEGEGKKRKVGDDTGVSVKCGVVSRVLAA